MPTSSGTAHNGDVGGVPPVALRARPRRTPLIAVVTYDDCRLLRNRLIGGADRILGAGPHRPLPRQPRR